jgi:hypothetical protein
LDRGLVKEVPKDKTAHQPCDKRNILAWDHFDIRPPVDAAKNKPVDQNLNGGVDHFPGDAQIIVFIIALQLIPRKPSDQIKMFDLLSQYQQCRFHKMVLSKEKIGVFIA